MLLKPSNTNKAIKYFAYITLGLSIIIALVLAFTLKQQEPDVELELTGYTIEGDEVPHPLRWLVALLVVVGGSFNALLLFAISEALSRLQMIEYNSERTYKDNQMRASS